MRGHEEINNIKREGLNCKKKRAREGDLLIRFSWIVTRYNKQLLREVGAVKGQRRRDHTTVQGGMCGSRLSRLFILIFHIYFIYFRNKRKLNLKGKKKEDGRLVDNVNRVGFPFLRLKRVPHEWTVSSGDGDIVAHVNVIIKPSKAKHRRWALPWKNGPFQLLGLIIIFLITYMRYNFTKW